MKSIFTVCFILVLQISHVKSQCWSQVSIGRDHGLAIHTDGTLWAWGLNQYGTFGDGTNSSKSTPTKASSSTDWKQISAGADYNLAIKNDGTLWAWGSNEYGVLGDGTVVDRNVPTKIGTDSNWKQVSASTFQSAAIKNDGTVWLWGNNQYGQLGDGTMFNSKSTPIKLSSISNCIQVSSGYLFYTFILDDGSLWSLGVNPFGQLGDGSIIDRTAPVRVGVSNNWSSISSGGFHNVAIQKDGTLWAWGRGTSSQIGNGANLDQSTPQKIGSSIEWKQVSAGNNYSTAIKNEGSLWAWGSNFSGQLGIGSYISKNIPTKIGTEDSWNFVEAGEHSVSLALKKDGSSWAWGDNAFGQLGDGTKIERSAPVIVICSPISGLLSQQVLNIDLKLHPNPAVEYVALKFDILKKDHYRIRIHDVAGNILYKKSIREEGAYSENIDISSFIPGTYFLTLSNQEGLKSLAFVKL